MDGITEMVLPTALVIPPYTASFAPIPQVQPFTYRDGITMLGKLEGLTKYICKTVIPYIDENFTNLTNGVESDINALVELINAAIDSIINSSIEVQDSVVAGIFNNPASATRIVTDALYAAKSVVDALETLTSTGRLSQTAMDAVYAHKTDLDALTATVSANYVSLDARITTNTAATTANATAIATETTNRQNADNLKRNIAQVVQSNSVDFNTLTATSVNTFAAAPTHRTRPTNQPGTLIVEVNGIAVTQLFYTNGTGVRARAFTRYFDGTAWSDWEFVDTKRSHIPRYKVTFIGDSYMAGFGLTSPSTQRWTSLISNDWGVAEQNLSNSGSGYINAGSAGSFVTQSLSVAADTDTVIISGGINDAPLAPTQAAITNAVNSIIANIRAAAPSAHIVFISPMLYQNDPTTAQSTVSGYIQAAVAAAGCRYLVNAEYIRINRDELCQGDGHPNAAGSVVIKEWVKDNVENMPRVGSTRGKFVREPSSDATFTGENVLAQGTIANARAGWYTITAQANMYKSSLGYMHIYAGVYNERIRNDVKSDTLVEYMVASIEYYHSGGDLYIGVGYEPNGASTTSVQGNRYTRVSAVWQGSN
jgi:lysophospholipase L1-like esterase